MKLKVLLMLLLGSCLCNAGQIKIDDPQTIVKYGNMVVNNLLNRGYMLYKGDKGLHYAEACAGLGALRFTEVTGNTADLDKVIERYSGFLNEDDQLIDRIEHVDYNVRGIVPLQIFLANKNEGYKKSGLSFADNQWKQEIEGGLTWQTRWWIDDMYMVGSLQMQAYRATGDIEYADKAARLLHAYIDKLQQPNGLFFHGPKFPHFWGRGNGWVAVSMAEVLRDLPKDNQHYTPILESYKKMMAGLLKYQSDNGLWRQLINNQYSWTETSCTAMFAYAMAIGVESDILPEAQYAPAVKKAWPALCANINRDGSIRDVCEGTGQKDDVEFYMNRRRITGDFHGQAPFLWLATELAD